MQLTSEDFYKDASGKMVLTAAFLLKRGFCCQSGCRHCPYQLPERDPLIPIELQMSSLDEELDKYDEND